MFLYHLRVLQLLEQARQENNVRAYHFALLRQLLESVSSFLGVGRISYALERIGFEDVEEIARIVNSPSPTRMSTTTNPTSSYRTAWRCLTRFMTKLNMRYKFVTHAS